MARDSFLKTAAPLVILTFLVVYSFPAITRGHPELGCALYAFGSRVHLAFQNPGWLRDGCWHAVTAGEPSSAWRCGEFRVTWWA